MSDPPPDEAENETAEAVSTHEPAHIPDSHLPGPPVLPVLSAPDKPFIDVLLTRLAQGAQICTLGVLIFGYFHTVLPAFQLQQLKEQALKLQQQIADSKRQLGIKTQELDEASKALSGAQRHLLLTNLTWAIREHRPVISFTFDDAGDFVLDTKSRWPMPYADISQALDRLQQEDQEQHHNLAGILPRARQVLETNKLKFVCDPVDFAGVQKNYRSEIEKADSEGRRAAALVAAENSAATLNTVRSTRIAQLNKSVAEGLGILYGDCAEKERNFVNDLVKQAAP